jgi:hypothetical protein
VREKWVIEKTKRGRGGLSGKLSEGEVGYQENQVRERWVIRKTK